MIRKMGGWLIGAWLAAAAAAESMVTHKPGAPFVPTPEVVVQRMLELARVGPGDHVVDLGSGDGRIVIQAALHGARGEGVERNRNLVHEARINAARAGVSEAVTFVQQDLFSADLDQATVVAMYLLPDQAAQLRPRLLQLRPGTRVVSHGFDIGVWDPDESVEVAIGPGSAHSVFLWIVPARVAGRWTWRVEGRQFGWSVRQRHQRIESALEADGPVVLEHVTLRGGCVGLEARIAGVRHAFAGEVAQDRIEGVARVWVDGEVQESVWVAQRQPREDAVFA